MDPSGMHNRGSDNDFSGGGSDLPEDRSQDGPRRTTPWATLSARVIALVSRKGGVGKTTSAVNLGAALALSGHTVLVVGVDPQCGVCRTLGRGADELDGRLTDIFHGHRPLVHLAHTSPIKNLFFVSPAVRSLDEEEMYLRLMQDEVDTFVAEIDRARNLYDTILIDCPPTLGTTTRAALLACDSYLVPVQAEELCRDSVAPLLEFIDSFRNSMDLEEERARVSSGAAPRPLALEGLFLTMASERTRMGRHVAARVKADHAAALFESAIPRTTRLSEMALRGKPAVIYDRRSAGSRAYFHLADELVERFCSRNGMELPQPVLAGADDDLAREDAELSAERAGPRFPYTATAAGSTAARETLPSAGAGGSFDRFLRDLQGNPPERELPRASEESVAPEMVSLDDLLAEEERAENGKWDDDPWRLDRRGTGRSH